MNICLLGAESTGKTRLSLDLAAHLAAHGQPATVVPEVLREWCERMGRTPQPHEQEGIALEQARRVQAAEAESAPGTWVIADTAPLMVAVYSDMLFADRSLYDMALAHQRGYALTLLTGLDIPWVADGHQRDGPHVREPVDAHVRAALAQGGIGYRVVYGVGPERLTQALLAIDSVAGSRYGAPTSARNHLETRPWRCEQCSDPDCEHRLFSGLLARQPGASAG